MKSMVVYDSAYGNTAKVARAISSALEGSRAVMIKEAKQSDLNDLDLLVIGSPTQGGRPTKPTERFIHNLSAKVVRRTRVAVFDTRFLAKRQKRGLRLLMRVIGYAAPKMAKAVNSQGGIVISEPAGFIVNETEGPLDSGELERAAEWAHRLT